MTVDPLPNADSGAGCPPALRCADKPELCPPACNVEWHVAVHADSDSLFRHSGALFDCPMCKFPTSPVRSADV